MQWLGIIYNIVQSLDNDGLLREMLTHLTSGKELFQPPTTDPVLVADSDRGEGDGVLVVDCGRDVHRPAEELLGQAHQVLHGQHGQEDEDQQPDGLSDVARRSSRIVHPLDVGVMCKFMQNLCNPSRSGFCRFGRFLP